MTAKRLTTSRRQPAPLSLVDGNQRPIAPNWREKGKDLLSMGTQIGFWCSNGKGVDRGCCEPVLDVAFWLRAVTDRRAPEWLIKMILI